MWASLPEFPKIQFYIPKLSEKAFLSLMNHRRKPTPWWGWEAPLGYWGLSQMFTSNVKFSLWLFGFSSGMFLSSPVQILSVQIPLLCCVIVIAWLPQQFQTLLRMSSGSCVFWVWDWVLVLILACEFLRAETCFYLSVPDSVFLLTAWTRTLLTMLIWLLGSWLFFFVAKCFTVGPASLPQKGNDYLTNKLLLC